MSGAFRLEVRPFELQLAHRFTLATSSRTSTPAVLVELISDGMIGYGEASMPPYLGETPLSAQEFLQRVDLGVLRDPFRTADVLAAVDATAPGNTAAKAAFDIALHDWLGKALGQPVHRLLGLSPAAAPPTSFTIGIDAPDVVRQRLLAAAEHASYKVKLGGADDRGMIAAMREVTDKPIRVDVNQGWVDRERALDTIGWLAEHGVELVEQPMPRERVADLAWLRERSSLPIVADEGVQRLSDVAAASGVYDAINIKLMKCTGIREARDMIVTARALGLGVMLGCMTETSCAIAAAAQLGGLADWTDLDGAMLIANDPFEGTRIDAGRVLPSDEPGLGIRPRG